MFFDMRCHHRGRNMKGSNLFKVIAIGALVYAGAKAMHLMDE
ncbi:MAG: hypothetical protein P4N59_04075 [Negativicutes bacterium]|nr:hypothetical protein [Negativicutes bacterium]